MQVRFLFGAPIYGIKNKPLRGDARNTETGDAISSLRLLANCSKTAVVVFTVRVMMNAAEDRVLKKEGLNCPNAHPYCRVEQW